MNLFAKTALLRPIEKILIGFHVVDNLSVSADVLIKNFSQARIIKIYKYYAFIQNIEVSVFFSRISAFN